MDSRPENLGEYSSNESMQDVIERAQAFLEAACTSSEWSFGEPSSSHSSGSTGGHTRRDSDCIVLEAFTNRHDGNPVIGNRRRRADGVPVVESVVLDETLNDLEAHLVPSPPRKVSYNEPPPAPISCPICFESVFEQQAASTVCGHMFCHSCITREVEIRKKCPMCQRPLNLSQVIPIYVN